jgi:hypothetical protein
VKALSGRQPWWWAILHAGKRIENRVWNTSYRGPILLHAAKGCTRSEYEDALDWIQETFGVAEVAQYPALAEMQRGGIVGRALIIGVIPPSGMPPPLWPRDWKGLDLRWHMEEQYGFVLADVEPLPFVPFKGSLGLFEVPDEALRCVPPASSERQPR